MLYFYKVLKQIQNIQEYISTEKPADGYVFAVIVNDEFEREESIKEIIRLRGNRVVFAVPKTPADITKSVVKYTAIQNVLRKEKNLTESTVDELKYIAGDQRDLIDNYIDTHFFSPELKKTDYFYDGAQIEVRRRTGLSTLLSRICENVFGQTPVIVNENVNRENLSAPMKATRLRILESLLLPQIPKNFGLQGSQDINVVRSLYLVPRIISNLEEPKLNTTEGLDANFAGLFNLINAYITLSMNGERKLSELYKALKDPDDGMALRSGVIPFYIAAALYPYKTHTVFKRRNREVPLSAEVLEQINERPDEYSLRIENWDAG